MEIKNDSSSITADPRPPQSRIYEGRIDGFHGKTAEQQLQELIDREEYRELTALYALRIAHGISTADLFVDDGVFTATSPDGPFVVSGGSRDALERDLAPALLGPHNPLPQIHNHLIKVDDDHAVAMCSNENRAVHNGESFIGSGWYSDVLRKVEGRWRFVRRDMRYRHYVPLSAGWADQSSEK